MFAWKRQLASAAVRLPGNARRHGVSRRIYLRLAGSLGRPASADKVIRLREIRQCALGHWGSGRALAAAEDLLGEFGAGGEECCAGGGGPGDGCRCDGENVLRVGGDGWQEVRGGGRRGIGDQGGEEGATEFGELEMGERDEALAVEQDGERGGLREDADVGGDGQSGEAMGFEERPIHWDREHGDESAGDGGSLGVAGSVEGASVDSLYGPECEGDGEDYEKLRGGSRIGVLEPPAAEEVHQPGPEGDHPG